MNPLQKTNEYYMGESGFVWFEGIVVDIEDPEEVGRVKVRIFGIHPNTNDVLNEDLPWAMVLQPTSSASLSGIGTSPHGLLQGSQVFGFFRDGSSSQYPVVLGSYLGIPVAEAPSEPNSEYHSDGVKTLFTDPNGEYPVEALKGIPDTNRLARSTTHTDHPAYISKNESLETNVPTANEKGVWSEPLGFTTTSYTHNSVTEFKGGQVLEFDSTPENERTFIYHPSGSFQEYQTDGVFVTNISADEFHIVDNNFYGYVKNDYNLTVDTDCNIRVAETVDVEVVNGDVNIVVKTGNVNITVEGDANIDVGGNVVENIKGSVDKTVGGDLTYTIAGRCVIDSGRSVSITGSQIRLN